MSDTITVKRVLDAKATLGEGPLWDAEQKVLWWIDIEEGIVNRYDPRDGSNKRFVIGQRVGTVVRRTKGGLLLATENGFATYDPGSGTLEPICDPEAHLAQNRFNDGKCDPAGRCWAGTTNLDPLNHSTGALYTLDAQLSVKKHFGGVGVSNGIVWSRDATTMYYIDSMIGSIDAFDFHRESGTLGTRRSVFTVPDDMGIADGMAIDAGDQLWVAFWGGWCVAQIDPAAGRLVRKIELPVAQVTACAFGGDDLRDLYITTARDGLDEAGQLEQPEAGNLFMARTPVCGTESFMFGG